MKKALKKAISVLLVAVMVFGAAPLAGLVGLEFPVFNLFGTKAEAEETATSGTCGDNLTWIFDEETGELIISGTGKMTNWDYYSDAPWFGYCLSIKSVSIENGVTSIGDEAFLGCDNLTSATIPNSVTSIGDYAFYWCLNLTGVTIPDSVTSIGDVAFGFCETLASITIGNGVTSIGNSAFCDCFCLESITIPDGVTSIGDSAFSGCFSLENITVDSANTAYSSDEYGVLFNKDKTVLIQYPLGNTRTTYTIPDSVISIRDFALKNCRNIEEITIPDSVTSIGDSAFAYCYALASVTIPDSVTSIGYMAFVYCYNLSSITVDSANTVYLSDKYGVLFNKDKTELIQYPVGNSRTGYIIPDSVASIGDRAFTYCDSLESVIIPDSVTSIGNSAFAACSSLASVTIPDSVTSIDYMAFDRCLSLTNVVIPGSITSLREYMFSSCEGLTRVTISNGVTSIGYSVFENCYNLASIVISDSVISIDDYAFTSCTGLKDVYYTGTQENWNVISIGIENEPLLNANIHFNHIHTVSTVKESLDPTCTEKGYKTYVCVCGYSFTEFIPALNHKDTLVNVEAKAPTCTEIGWDTYEHCTACEYTTYAEKSALNHKDTLVRVEAQAPTCTEIGWDAYEYCTACTYTTYVEKGALKHDIVIDKAVAPTCTETGLTEGQHCSRCNDVTVAQKTVSVKFHNYTAKYDSAKHWEECDCGSKINVHNHSFIGGNDCSCGFKRVVDSSIKIKNNNGSKTINYGETLKLTAIVTNKPANAKIYWYVDGVKAGEGEVFNVNFENGTKIITVKLVDENGVVYQNSSGNEIADTENVTVNGGFFQKIISFFKNLFGMNRTVVQTIFKGIY